MVEPAPATKKPASPARTFFEWLRALLYAAVLFFLLLQFVLGWYLVPTPSMEPTIRGAGKDHPGDTVLVDKLTYRLRTPRRGEVVVFWPLAASKHPFVKRLAGLPGETIEIRDGRVLVNGIPVDLVGGQGPLRYENLPPYGTRERPVRIPADSYFFLGDNTEHSDDSRHWGFVPAKNIFGRALVVFWPLDRVGWIR